MINQRNSKGKRIGYWMIYYLNGKLSTKGNFINNNEIGYFERYNYSNGNLASKEYYI